MKSTFLKFLVYFLQSAIAGHLANQWRATVMTLLGWGDEHGVKTGPLLPYKNEKGKKSHASCNAFDLWCCYI